MTEDKKNEDSAFPHSNHLEIQGGTTLRDWFAGQTLAGLCSSEYWPSYYDPTRRIEDREKLAGLAYALADEMLRARKL